MTEFFQDTLFLKRMQTLSYPNLKIKILEIMTEMKNKDNQLDIRCFICILEKIIEPSVSYTHSTSTVYMYSVKLWNDFIYNSKKDFDMLIHYDRGGICF